MHIKALYVVPRYIFSLITAILRQYLEQTADIISHSFSFEHLHRSKKNIVEAQIKKINFKAFIWGFSRGAPLNYVKIFVSNLSTDMKNN